MPTCTIHIKDEVNCKIEGLELPTRKKLVDRFKFEIPGARYTPAVRLGRWDGKVSFFNLGGSTYINLLEQILPMLDQEGYDIDLEDHRNYRTQFEFSTFTEDTFQDRSWPDTHPLKGQPVRFRDYQVEIINNFLKNPQSVQEVATGAGKTVMTAALSASIEPYGNSVIIVPNKSLVTQTEADYINLGLDVGVYYGDRKEIGHKHTICTWQSLNVLIKNSRDRDEPASTRLAKDPTDYVIDDLVDKLVCVIVDECHASKADALKSLLTGTFSRVPIRWGLTGTIPKEDFARYSLVCGIGPTMGQLSAKELQESGHLAQCHVHVVQMVDHVEYRDYPSELKYLVENEPRLDYISDLVSRIKDSGNTLLLVDRVATGKSLAQKIPDSVFVSGATKSKDRKEEYDEVAIANGKVIIATYGVAAVGINIVRIHNVVLLEPGKSFVRTIQSIGRGLRKGFDKDFVDIYDITSTCKFSKRHLAARKKFYTEAQYEYTVEKVNWQ
jgi:superfamily II DNA or RNA helicase